MARSEIAVEAECNPFRGHIVDAELAPNETGLSTSCCCHEMSKWQIQWHDIGRPRPSRARPRAWMNQPLWRHQCCRNGHLTSPMPRIGDVPACNRHPPSILSAVVLSTKALLAFHDPSRTSAHFYHLHFQSIHIKSTSADMYIPSPQVIITTGLGLLGSITQRKFDPAVESIHRVSVEKF